MWIPLIAIALTPVRVGSGRSPGAVDLPIVKDNFGLPFIPGSSFKGALKGLVGMNCLDGDSIDCEKCPQVCCLLGPEDGSDGMSKLSFGDLYPVLTPYPSSNKLYILLTSEFLLSRYSFLWGDNYYEIKDVEEVNMGIDKIKLRRVKLSEELDATLKRHNPLYKEEDVYLIPEGLLNLLLSKSTIKVTRNKIDFLAGSVKKRALWTEEYLPHGTTFMGFVNITSYENEYCRKYKVSRDLVSILNDINIDKEFYLVIGGHESTGKGLMKVIFLA